MSKQSASLPRAVIVIRTVSLAFALLLLGAMIVYIARVGGQAENVLSKTGSRGNEVRQIQQRLKNWGYYTGEVDGIFGVETKKAVMSFQRKNGLTVDGIAGNATLKAMGIQSSQQTGGNGGYSNSDVALLANIISAEARGEPFEGQVAVGAVVLNRVEHPPSLIRSRALSISRAHSRRSQMARSTRRSLNLPKRLRAKRWPAPTHRAARSIIIILTRPQTNGSGRVQLSNVLAPICFAVRPVKRFPPIFRRLGRSFELLGRQIWYNLL